METVYHSKLDCKVVKKTREAAENGKTASGHHTTVFPSNGNNCPTSPSNLSKSKGIATHTEGNSLFEDTT